MFYKLRCWLGFAPQSPTAPHLAAGEPPLPGLDRWHNPLPSEFGRKLSARVRGMRYRMKKWIEAGMPILPSHKLDTRSPTFVLLIMIIFVIGMILPEIMGWTTGTTYGYPNL